MNYQRLLYFKPESNPIGNRQKKLIIFHTIFCSAKSTELLHSPPVYESDIDTLDQEFYDYALPVQDDDFYYVSWEDPIYDVFQEYDYSGMNLD